MRSPFLPKRPDFLLECPGIARLLVQLPVCLGNRGGRHEAGRIKVGERLFLFSLLDPLTDPGSIHSGIDDEASDMDILGAEFPRDALGDGASLSPSRHLAQIVKPSAANFFAMAAPI